MSHLPESIKQVAQARQNFIAVASGLTDEQANLKPAPDAWSINENVEHMVWAEWGGINGMWKALHGIKTGNPVFKAMLCTGVYPLKKLLKKHGSPKSRYLKSLSPDGVDPSYTGTMHWKAVKVCWKT